MNTLMILSAICYFLGMTKFFMHMAVRKNGFFYMATLMIIIGFILHTAMLFTLSAETGHAPYANPFGQASFFAWTTMGALISAILYFRVTHIGAFVSPVGFLIMFYSFTLPSGDPSTTPTTEFWLTMHFTLGFLALSSFAVMFSASVMYLMQERRLKSHQLTGWFKKMPDLDTLDNLYYGSLIFGFPLITVGYGSAVIWSWSKFGNWYGPDLVRVLPFVFVWLLYAVLISGRLLFKWRGHKITLFGALAFGAAILSLGIHVY